eukprot:5038215-Prymnesium_polylepis.1
MRTRRDARLRRPRILRSQYATSGPSRVLKRSRASMRVPRVAVSRLGKSTEHPRTSYGAPIGARRTFVSPRAALGRRTGAPLRLRSAEARAPRCLRRSSVESSVCLPQSTRLSYDMTIDLCGLRVGSRAPRELDIRAGR